jgi:hypothetical protein
MLSPVDRKTPTERTRPLKSGNEIVAKIRGLYSKPQRSDLWKSNDERPAYCVGGALCIFRGIRASFPSIQVFASELCRANPNLTDSRVAEDFAEDIIDANDLGNFEGAWRLLAEALEAS